VAGGAPSAWETNVSDEGFAVAETPPFTSKVTGTFSVVPSPEVTVMVPDKCRRSSPMAR
jgi:hypothetical protein